MTDTEHALRLPNFRGPMTVLLLVTYGAAVLAAGAAWGGSFSGLLVGAERPQATETAPAAPSPGLEMELERTLLSEQGLAP